MSPFKSIFKQLLFWMLFFAFTHLVFILYHLREVRAASDALSIASVFYHALALDFSMTCYLVLPVFFALVVNILVPGRFFPWFYKIYTGILLFACSFILGGELGIYREWQTKLNLKALMYLQRPTEAYASTSGASFFFLLFLAIATFVLWFWLYRKYFLPKLNPCSQRYLQCILFLLLTPVFLFFGIRGGFSKFPITVSNAQFSQSPILNDAATNSAYYLAFNVMKGSSFMQKNPFDFYPQAEAEQTVANLFEAEKDSTLQVLANRRPNIVLVILEGWSADMVESLGGDAGITPQFRNLEKGGLLFTDFFANGNRSQQGISALLSSYPPIMYSHIVDYPDKYAKLPSFPAELKKSGYQTLFMYGGDLFFGNIYPYILFNQFDKVLTESDFNARIKRGRLGVHDEFLYERALAEMGSMKEPFLAAMFTLSSHIPYDQPLQNALKWNFKGMDYVNSVYYADQCLGNFIRKAQQQPWYKNTLFVFVADHGHPTYKNHYHLSDTYHHIPMLWYGEALDPEWKGKDYAGLGSHVDFAKTLMTQMGLPATDYSWGSNLFNPTRKQFIYFESSDYFGWKSPAGYYNYNRMENRYLYKRIETSKIQTTLRDGNSYIQVLYQQFMDF